MGYNEQWYIPDHDGLILDDIVHVNDLVELLILLLRLLVPLLQSKFFVIIHFILHLSILVHREVLPIEYV